MQSSLLSNSQNVAINEGRHISLDKCVLCHRPFYDIHSTRFCPVCEDKIQRAPLRDDILSRPNTGSRSTTMYLPSHDRGYSPVLSPTPKTRPLRKILCPHCKNPNLLQNLTSSSDFRCSVCQNPIPSIYHY